MSLREKKKPPGTGGLTEATPKMRRRMDGCASARHAAAWESATEGDAMFETRPKLVFPLLEEPRERLSKKQPQVLLLLAAVKED
ncbi:MAG TPA: hypothetical protein VM661_17280 [Candidatus Sulfotelmatobacter sp.]|jgi:hypothetical protein|nr:hypothetical protein [Candidatus Sulfotelmatobacter sp.]